MLKNYLKIGLRNFLKNKGYSAISIGGLAIGLAGFILILMYVDYEFSYDRWFPDHGQIYRAEFDGNFDGKTPFRGGLLPDGMAAAGVSEVPEIKAGTRLAGAGMIFKQGDKQIRANKCYFGDSSFFDIFKYRFLYGDPHTALDASASVVLTKELSEKIFGKENPVGKSLYLLSEKMTLKVTGVLDDEKRPTHLSFEAIASNNDNSNSWGNNHTLTYFLLKENANPLVVQQQLSEVLRSKILPGELKGAGMSKEEWIKSGRKRDVHIQPISELHLHPFWDETSSKVIYTTIIAIFLLGLFILLIGAINFTNMAIARAAARAKEVGIRKVMGSTRAALGKQFILEYLMQCVAALFIALMIAELCLPLFNHTLDIELRLFSRFNFWRHGLEILIAVLAVALLAGLYPALFLSGYQPAKVLKGNFSRGTQNSRLRRSLLTVQLLIAVLFIIGTSVVFSQIKYMQQKDLGFQPDQIISFELMDKSFGDYHSFKNRLEAVPGVMDVSRAMSSLSNFYSWNSLDFRGDNFSAATEQVGFNYFKTLGVKTLEGRVFSPAYGSDSVDGCVLNETAVKAMHLDHPVGSVVSFNGSRFHVIGVVNDYQFLGVDKAVPPMFFFMQKEPAWFESRGNAFIKIKAAEMQPALAAIKDIWQEYSPSFDFSFRYANEVYASAVDKYARQGKVFLTFALLNILLALIGLYSLASFISKSKTKEIGIRKVLGASDSDILKMLNKSFVLMVIIANLIAWPATYLLIRQWLQSFPYRIAVSLVPFIIATAVSVVLTVATVSLQGRKAMRANPVDALKYE